VKFVILETTFTAPEHGHAQPEQKHTVSQGIICQPVPDSGQPLSYLSCCLPALFAMKSDISWQ